MVLIQESVTLCCLTSKRISKNISGVTADIKLSFDEHIIKIWKIANKKINALSRTNHYMKQNQKETLSFFIIAHFNYCSFIWMFWSKKSTRKINAVHERSL